MGISLPPVEDEEEYQRWLREQAKPRPLPAPPPIARPDVTAVAPRPPQEPPGPGLWETVAEVNKGVRRALVPSRRAPENALKNLEAGAFKFGKEQGDFLAAQNPGKMPNRQDYATADEYSGAMGDFAERYTKGWLNVMSTVEGGGVPKGGRVAKAPKPPAAAPIKRKIETVPFDAYSRLESAVEAAPFEKGTAEQWSAALSKNVAKGEREYRRVDQLLESKKGQVLERDALRQQLEENPIKIERSQYGGTKRYKTDEIEWQPHPHNPDVWNTQATLSSARFDATVERNSADGRFYVEVAGFPKKEFPTLEEAQKEGVRLVSIQKAYKEGWRIKPQGDPGTGEVFVVERPDGVGVQFGNTREEAERWMAAHANTARLERGEVKRPRFEGWKQPGGENYTETVLKLERNPLTELPPGYGIQPLKREGFEIGALTFAQAKKRGWDLQKADGGGWWMIKPDGNIRGMANTTNFKKAQEMLVREAEMAKGGRTRITDPHLDESQRFEVDPDEYYGQPYREWAAMHEPGVDREWVVTDPGGASLDATVGPDPATAKQTALRHLAPRPFVQAGHFPDENPLGHHRTTDHTRKDGTKERFVEELQSDWAQRARKKALAEKAIKELPAKIEAMDAAHAAGQPVDRLEYKRIGKELDKARWTAQELANLPGDQPYQKTEEWTELLLKDIIDQALADGIDRITIATGAQNAQHYNLQKAVDRITYNRATGKLQAWKNGNVEHEGNYDWRGLDPVIGKDAAERLLADETLQPGPDPDNPLHVLEGEGLKVGGTGMEGFYDEMVPKIAKNYAKKLGIDLQIEPSDLFSGPALKARFKPAPDDLPAGEGSYRQWGDDELQMFTDPATGDLKPSLFKQGADLLEDPDFVDGLAPEGELNGRIPDDELVDYFRELDRDVSRGSTVHQVLDTQPPVVRQQIMDILGLQRVKALPPRTHIVEGRIYPKPVMLNNIKRAIRDEEGGEVDFEDAGPVAAQLMDIRDRITHGQDPKEAIEDSLTQLMEDIDVHAAEIVADALELNWKPVPERTKNPSFRVEPFKTAGPQPLWAVGAGGAAAMALQQQGGGGGLPPVPDEAEFQAWQAKQGGGKPLPPVDDEAEFEAWKAAQAPAPKKGILERVNTAARDFRRAAIPKTLEKLEKGATRAGEEYGRAAVEVGNAIKVYLDPAKVNTEESKQAGRVLMLAIASEVLPLPVILRARAALKQAGVKIPSTPKATPERPVWDRNAQPIDQPQPLTQEQEILRARLRTEGIEPSGAMRRRATAPPPPVEPGPDAVTYTTPSSVKRRPKPEAPANLTHRVDGTEGNRTDASIIATDQTGKRIGYFKYSILNGRIYPKDLDVLPEFRRKGIATSMYDRVRAEHPDLELDNSAFNRTEDGDVFREAYNERRNLGRSPESHEDYADDLGEVYDATHLSDKKTPPATPVERRADPEAPRVTWTPEERARYITDAQKAYAATINKPWSQWTNEEKIGYFKGQEAVKADAPWKPKAAAAEPAAETWPPLPKEGDIKPVAAAGGEGVDMRPGIARDVNKGNQPTQLSSPLRLPEPTDADRAVVQPKGYKEVSPEEVAARKAAEKPEPVATGSPRSVRDEVPEGAKVDEDGLFFEHRTPGGELRDFRRVSTDGLVKAHREMEEQILRDQQLSVYRNVEADVSGTQYGVNINAATKTSRGTSQQAEAAERLRNYEKVMKRIDAELAKRGVTTEDLIARREAQEELEAAIEREAMDYADRMESVDTDFDFDDLPEGEIAIPSSGSRRSMAKASREPAEEPISDVLNVAKLNLGSRTAEQRMAAKLEEFRGLREQNKQTWAEADINRAEILDELRAQDPLALSTEKAKKLSGEELLARRDLVRENDGIIEGLSKRLEEAATPEEHRQAAELLERAVAHNDALLSDLVVGSSQKGRDLNLLKRIANRSLDVDVWRIQAKRMLGDRPLTAEIDAMIRKLAQEAQDACG